MPTRECRRARRFMRVPALAAIAAVGLIVCLHAPVSAAEYDDYLTTVDTAAIRGILQKYDSPLPWWTIAAFKYNCPSFDAAGFLAVAWAESSLGKGCDYKNNPGSIKGGPPGALWADLSLGRSPAGYNIYPDLRAGTRAMIHLLMERGYNQVLASHDFRRFANRYYGRHVPGLEGYLRNLCSAHARIVSDAARYGADW